MPTNFVWNMLNKVTSDKLCICMALNCKYLSLKFNIQFALASSASESSMAIGN